MNIFNASKVLYICIFTSIIICFACNPNNKNNDSKGVQNAETGIANGGDISGSNDGFIDGKDTVVSSKNLNVQFNELYKTLHLSSLPIKNEGELDGFVAVPNSLIDAFEFLHKREWSNYDRNTLHIMKLPDHKKINVVIVRVDDTSPGVGQFLCTFLNAKFVDVLHISQWEDEASRAKWFSINDRYEVLVEDAEFIDNDSNDIGSEDVVWRVIEQNTYIISDDGKFIKKL